MRVVILVKIRAQQGTIAIEKWKAIDTSGRPGAATTRARAASAREPVKVEEMLASRPDVGGRDANPLDPDSYVVARGPLRLGAAELFLHDPRPGEYDIVFDRDVLVDLAIRVWQPVAS